MVELGVLITAASLVTFVIVSTRRHMEERMIEDKLKKFMFEDWLEYEHRKAREAQKEE